MVDTDLRNTDLRCCCFVKNCPCPEFPELCLVRRAGNRAQLMLVVCLLWLWSRAGEQAKGCLLPDGVRRSCPAMTISGQFSRDRKTLLQWDGHQASRFHLETHLCLLRKYGSESVHPSCSSKEAGKRWEPLWWGWLRVISQTGMEAFAHTVISMVSHMDYTWTVQSA